MEVSPFFFRWAVQAARRYQSFSPPSSPPTPSTPSSISPSSFIPPLLRPSLMGVSLYRPIWNDILWRPFSPPRQERWTQSELRERKRSERKLEGGKQRGETEKEQHETHGNGQTVQKKAGGQGRKRRRRDQGEPFLLQLPCSWGALYFDSAWRGFREWLHARRNLLLRSTHYQPRPVSSQPPHHSPSSSSASPLMGLPSSFLSPRPSFDVPFAKSNGWVRSWKRLVIRYMVERGLYMVYPGGVESEGMGGGNGAREEGGTGAQGGGEGERASEWRVEGDGETVQNEERRRGEETGEEEWRGMGGGSLSTTHAEAGENVKLRSLQSLYNVPLIQDKDIGVAFQPLLPHPSEMKTFDIYHNLIPSLNWAKHFPLSPPPYFSPTPSSSAASSSFSVPSTRPSSPPSIALSASSLPRRGRVRCWDSNMTMWCRLTHASLNPSRLLSDLRSISEKESERESQEDERGRKARLRFRMLSLGPAPLRGNGVETLSRRERERERGSVFNGNLTLPTLRHRCCEENIPEIHLASGLWSDGGRTCGVRFRDPVYFIGLPNFPQ